MHLLQGKGSIVRLLNSTLKQHVLCGDTCFMKNIHVLQKHSKNGCKTTQNQRFYSLTRSKLANKFEKDGIKEIKVKPKSTELRRLIQLGKSERPKIAGAVGFFILSSSVTLAVPFCMGKVIDIINTASQDGSLTEKLNTFCSVLLVVFIIGGLANFGRVYLLQIAEERIILKMRNKLFSSVMRQEIGFFDKTRTGELVSRLSSDTALLGNCLTFNISDGLRAGAQAGGSIGMMVYVSPKLTLIALCIVPPVAIASIVYGRYVKRLTKDVQNSLASATTVAEEKLSNIRTVRAFAKEDQVIASYDSELQKVLALVYKQALASGVFWGSTGLSGNIIIISVLYAGGMLMSESLLTIGDLSAFLLYAAYIGISVGGLTSFYSELMRGLGASSRIWELADRQPLIPVKGGMIPSSPVVGEVLMENLSFSYPMRSDAAVLSNFSIHIPAGSVTALVGSSGSGKSTIGHMLLRFYDPDKGTIYFDGQDIRNLDPTWLRNQIGVVSQEPALFSCSIADNIKYGAIDPESVSMEMIETAARQANAYMFIKNFPDQFNTMVGEKGVMLSGGQKQRIALARAIVKNPRILLLDEATSALDSESEYYVKEALSRLMVGRTVITIAHRLSTIRTADQIAVLDNGRVAELGPYQDLLKIEEGIFRKLVEKQAITA